MKCPYCNADNNSVTNGKQTEKGNYRRTRKCLNCNRRFRTIEYYIENRSRKR